MALYKGSLEPVDEKTRPLNHVSKVHVGIHKPRGQPLGEGVCQMIILLHYLHSKSGHLGGGGLNFPKKWARGLWMASRVAQILRSCRGGPCQGAKFECGFKLLLYVELVNTCPADGNCCWTLKPGCQGDRRIGSSIPIATSEGLV